MDKRNLEEQEILNFWKEKKIYEKSRKNNSRGRKFYMVDGPPYATGYIHLGTALNKTLKDIAMRSRRMQRFNVLDRPGYDTHGIPIELQIEKEIGLTSKKDIEKYGIDNFTEKCRDFATKFVRIMNDEFKNLGVWMDWDNPYLTLSDKYMEKVWGVLKEADKKNLIYLGKYPVHVCPRCETVVSYNEIEYGKQKDTSIIVKFPLEGEKNTFLLIWTTTPWTLPANTGVMANPAEIYQKIELSNGEKWILAKDRVIELMSKLELGFSIKDEFLGKYMEGWKYLNPLKENLNMNIKKGYIVVLSARYVNTHEGTGLVHCAPGHGKEDYEVGREYGLDNPSPVLTNGIMTSEAGKYSGKKAKIADAEIIEDLKKEKALITSFAYEHEYPLCWRDKSPLLMISQPQWFLKISEIQKKLLKDNKETNWIPKWAQLRMNGWLEGIGDWPISRQRYWGTPLPIWYDPETGEKIVVGSIAELKKKSGKNKINMHKPGIDEIEIIGKSGKILKRVLEVLDVWLDAGVASWAIMESEKQIKKFWPADLNIEGKDQIRGWWNSQLILSEIMFGKKPFKNVMMHGMILDISKKKMSKSSGNVTTPAEIIEKYGRDVLRYYCAKLSKGEDLLLDEKEFLEIDKFFTIIYNINSFINQIDNEKNKNNIEDKWIVSRYNSVIRDSMRAYNSYRFPEVTQILENFIFHDLSKTYIQIIRERSYEAKKILSEMFTGVLQILAPISPFFTERLWQEIRAKNKAREESIHLSVFPSLNERKIDDKLEREFELALKIIELGLSERDKLKIGLRWPLSKASVLSKNILSRDLQEIIKRQLNIKKITMKKGEKLIVEIDGAQTYELLAEGFARELTRNIQAERKKSGLVKNDFIYLKIACDGELKKMLTPHINFLLDRTNSKNIYFVDDKEINSPKIFMIKDRKIFINFSKTVKE